MCVCACSALRVRVCCRRAPPTHSHAPYEGQRAGMRSRSTVPVQEQRHAVACRGVPRPLAGTAGRSIVPTQKISRETWSLRSGEGGSPLRARPPTSSKNAAQLLAGSCWSCKAGAAPLLPMLASSARGGVTGSAGAAGRLVVRTGGGSGSQSLPGDEEERVARSLPATSPQPAARRPSEQAMTTSSKPALPSAAWPPPQHCHSDPNFIPDSAPGVATQQRKKWPRLSHAARGTTGAATP